MIVALMIIYGLCLLLTDITEMSIEGFLFLVCLTFVGFIIDEIITIRKSK